jgi:hypothetical protein
MFTRVSRLLAVTGAAVLVASAIGTWSAAGAPAGTPFAQAVFASFASGSEVHVGAVTAGGTTLAGVEQAFSGVSTSSAGLINPLSSQVTPPALIQPALGGGANTYARGTGLEVGLGTTAPTVNQILLPGLAQSQAPPIAAPVVKTLLPINIPGVLVAGVLKGIAATSYSPTFCPVGQPLAYGEGDAAGVALLGSPPVLGLSGSQTQTAQSQSRTDLFANPDGTFGLISQIHEIIAPISINLGSALSLQISVGGTGINSPVTLQAITDGEGHSGFQVVNNSAQVVVSLVAAGVTTNLVSLSLNQLLGQGGLTISNATPVIGPLLTALGVNLLLAVATPPQAIATSGANTTAAQFNLVSLHVAVGALNIANMNIGHMEAAVALPRGSIACTIPVAKAANPTTVGAGQSFTWTISIPSSSTALADSSCDLTNIAATDVIAVTSGTPMFTVGAISNGGTFDSLTNTVTWSSLGTYHPGDPPITLTVEVTVPADSGAGVLQDTVNVTSGLGNCTGGATGVATLIGPNLATVVLTGTITLVGPTITSAITVPPTTTPPPTTTVPPTTAAPTTAAPTTATTPTTASPTTASATTQPPTLPVTGGSPPLAWLGVALLGAAVVCRRIGSKATTD